MAPRSPKLASSKSEGNEILQSITVLSGRVIESPGGNMNNISNLNSFICIVPILKSFSETKWCDTSTLIMTAIIHFCKTKLDIKSSREYCFFFFFYTCKIGCFLSQQQHLFGIYSVVPTTYLVIALLSLSFYS